MKQFTDIKTLEDACKVLELDPNNVIPDFSYYPEKDRVSMKAHAKLVIIVRASNQLYLCSLETRLKWIGF